MKKTLKFGLSVAAIYGIVAIEEYTRTKSWIPFLFFGALATIFVLLATTRDKDYSS